jgi:hypothetical protein
VAGAGDRFSLFRYVFTLKQLTGPSVSSLVVMEDVSAIISLPEDPPSLEQIILNLFRERDERRAG